jgi:hypothetical protein
MQYTEQFAKHPDVYLVSCDVEVIDEAGSYQHTLPTIPSMLTPTNDVSQLIEWNPFRTPAVVVRKKAYEVLGGFDVALTHAADWDMWIRVIHHFRGLHLNVPLCQYRVHPFNETSRAFRTGEDILDLERVFYKFLKAGLPVREDVFKEKLGGVSWWQYVNYLDGNMPDAAQTLKRICRRYWPAGKIWRKELQRKLRRLVGQKRPK